MAGNPRVMLGSEGEVYRERWLTEPSLATNLCSREAWTCAHTHTHKASLQKTLKECVLDRLTSAGLLEMVTPFSLGMLAELLGELGPEPGALLQAESRVHKDRDVSFVSHIPAPKISSLWEKKV